MYSLLDFKASCHFTTKNPITTILLLRHKLAPRRPKNTIAAQPAEPLTDKRKALNPCDAPLPPVLSTLLFVLGFCFSFLLPHTMLALTYSTGFFRERRISHFVVFRCGICFFEDSRRRRNVPVVQHDDNARVINCAHGHGNTRGC
jgi:hypothetical protein